MSSQSQPSPGPHESGAEGLYFSYGSNMHLQQMASRCPESTLFAKGILRNYKWQINSRGGANVTEGSREDFVEGIIFTVSPSDVQALRHYEGVKQQFYVEKRLDIEVEFLLDKALEGRKPADAAETLAQYRSRSKLTGAVVPGQTHVQSDSTSENRRLQISPDGSTTSHQSGLESSTSKAEEQVFVHQKDQKSEGISLIEFAMLPQSSLEPQRYSEQLETSEQLSRYKTPSCNRATNARGEKVFREALIYISDKHQLPGDIREEYVGRMQMAMADARMLGVSKNYLESSLHPLVFGKRTDARLN